MIYLVMDQPAVSEPQITALGLRAVLDAGHTQVTTRHQGRVACLIADPSLPPQQLRLEASRQRMALWSKEPEIHVLMWTDPRPTPALLERPQMLPGHYVRLGDGADWLIPMARRWDAEQDRAVPMAPRRFERDSAGNWVATGPVAQYARLWGVCTWWADRKLADGQVELSIDELANAAVAALTVNYRVGAVECELLDLLNEQSTFGVLDAVIDWPTVLAWAKKKAECAGFSTGPGFGG